MRRLSIRSTISTAILICLACLAVVATAQTPAWKIYEFPNDGFKASYPSPPDLQRKTVQTSAGEFELRSYTAQLGDTALIVGICDYGAAVAGKSSDQMLLGAKNSMLSNSASRLISEKNITLGNNPGVQFEAENSATRTIARMYMVGTTLYESLVVSPISKRSDQTEQFLDSFQLVNRTKHIPEN